MAKTAGEVVPVCPRCGYDQSGACGTWLSECPLEGTCPECGLRFEWADAFNPQRKRLPWLFEHKRPLSLGITRAYRSWLMAMIPPRFWSRVTPACSSTWVVVLWPVVLMGSLIAVGGTTRAVYLYATGWTGPWTAWGGGVARGWTRAQMIAVEAWGNPLWPRWADLWDDSLYWQAIGRVHAGPAAAICCAFVCGAVLSCLTTSRRICGVKGSHIVRAAVYRVAPLGALYGGWLVISFAALLLPRSYWVYQFPRWALPVALLLALAWGAWWWRTAILTGWVMPRARLAANLIAVCDVLTGVVVMTLVDPYGVGRLL